MKGYSQSFSVFALALVMGSTWAAVPGGVEEVEGNQLKSNSSNSHISKMLGKFQLTKSVNFEEYLYELGVGYVWRKLGASATPLTEFYNNNGDWTIKTSTTFKTTEINFKLGVPFEENTADGRYCTSVITLEEDMDRMIHSQQCGPSYVPKNVIIREFTDKHMIMRLKAGNVESIRTYDRLP